MSNIVDVAIFHVKFIKMTPSRIDIEIIKIKENGIADPHLGGQSRSTPQTSTAINKYHAQTIKPQKRNKYSPQTVMVKLVMYRTNQSVISLK